MTVILELNLVDEINAHSLLDEGDILDMEHLIEMMKVVRPLPKDLNITEFLSVISKSSVVNDIQDTSNLNFTTPSAESSTF